MKYPNRLAECRSRAGLKQREAAIALGVKLKTYQNYEYGERDIKGAVYLKLRNIFQCNIEDMLPVSDPVTLAPISPKAAGLLDAFDSLNDEGQDKVVTYADDLLPTHAKKSGTSDMVQETA